MGLRQGTRIGGGLTGRAAASYLVVAAGIALALARREDGAAGLLLGLLHCSCGLAIQLPWRRVAAFLLPFVAYVLLWATFTIVRGVCGHASWAEKTKYWVPDAERWLFSRLPSAALQDHFFTLGTPVWYDYALGVVYYSFFSVPWIVALVLMARHRPAFWYHFRGLVALKVSALAIYFALPTAPPWMVGLATGDIARIADLVGLRQTTGETAPGSTAGASLMGDPNPIAAMPSVHMGVICILAVTAWHFGGRWPRLLSVAYAVAMAASLVYLGEHYVLDVAAGAVIAVACCVSVNRYSVRDLIRRPRGAGLDRRSPETAVWQREPATAIRIVEPAD